MSMSSRHDDVEPERHTDFSLSPSIVVLETSYDQLPAQIHTPNIAGIPTEDL